MVQKGFFLEVKSFANAHICHPSPLNCFVAHSHLLSVAYTVYRVFRLLTGNYGGGIRLFEKGLVALDCTTREYCETVTREEHLA